MKPSLNFCGEQILRLQNLPFFQQTGQEAYRGLATALRDEARTDEEAEAAISALLADSARASNHQTNRMPSEGEIRLWVRETRPEKYDTPPPASSKAGCGRTFDGWWYADANGKTHQSQCVGGWVHRRVMRPAPGVFDEYGQPKQQPYDFAGKCKCDGGWL